jgi:hypothetical protein
MPRAAVTSLAVALLAVLVGCGTSAAPPPAAQAPVPVGAVDRTEYKVTITGHVGRWNDQTHEWDPTDPFRRVATLVIESDPTRDGGVAVGLSTGPFTDFTTGALHVVSNSYLLRDDGYTAEESWRAQTPMATVVSSPTGHTATIDPQVAQSVHLNNFVVAGSPLGVPRQILEGSITVEATEPAVKGSLTLFGGEYIDTGSGTYASEIYDAAFSS